ncbi:MAG TPA: hypothetical protein VNH11_28965 [Pirellulales bacterium]|nr:hypothetical protein [Pirellulales bacterium]
MQKQTWPLLVLLSFAVAPASVAASPPWQKLALFKQIDADPNKQYLLTDRQGPWVIMAAVFSGEQAEEQADELVYELRSKFKLRAYRYERDFDFSKGELTHRVDQYGQPVKMKYRVKQMHEIAVMVGDFPSVDDPQAQKVLTKLRALEPECLDTKKRAKQGKKQYRTLAQWQDTVNAQVSKNRQPAGPMRRAIVTTNPLLPADYFAPKGVDSLVLKMNEPVQYSLLKCSGRFTCKIATFAGAITVNPKEIEEIQKKARKFESRLEDAAAKAHEMTVALRAKGYEAWEFHDRYSSIVTVGSFDAVGTRRDDGQIDYNPKLCELMETFSAPKKAVPGQAATKLGDPFVVQTKLGKIACDVVAVPLEVPRRSISRDYDRPAISLR